jgi:hypothetical protein
MTVSELHQLTAALIAQGQGDAEVAINFDTFAESENGSILEVEKGELRIVQGADDSGPMGKEFPFLVLSGPLEFHAHGDPLPVGPAE